MCSIFGVYNENWTTKDKKEGIRDNLIYCAEVAARRGRDALGVACFVDNQYSGGFHLPLSRGTSEEYIAELAKAHLTRIFSGLPDEVRSFTLLGNLRAEPTTEWLHDSVSASDVQPYTNGDRTIWAVHNGTIANDDQFIPHHAPTKVDSQAIPYAVSLGKTDQLVGSLASAVFDTTDGSLMFLRNYRPICAYRSGTFSKLGAGNNSIWFHSIDEALTSLGMTNKVLVNPNTISTHSVNGITGSSHCTFDPAESNLDSAVVILSGGLDSTVTAEIACSKHNTVMLLHFHYGARAQSRETEAVTAIHKSLQEAYPDKQIGLKFLELSFLKELGGNPLVDHTMEVAEGKAGIEFAKEWVPYRNGLMASMAIAYCDRWGYSNIYLGTNLEEAGAYCLTDIPNNMVLKEDGTFTLPSKIKLGDSLLGLNSDGDVEVTRVKALHTRTCQSIIRFGLTNKEHPELYKVYEATPEHKFAVTGRGWVELQNIEIGDELYSQGSPVKRLIVSSIEEIVSEDGFEVYDFTCSPFHNFFIGLDRVLTHNCDNEREFYDLLTKAAEIGSKSHPRIVTPLENLMKWEIVKLGLELGAPIDLSWSCYKGGEKPCATCGPCLMRRTAFAMNGVEDMLVYENPSASLVGLPENKAESLIQN